MRLTSGPLGRGYAATATTIAKMHELVRLGVLGQHSLMLKGIVDQAIRHLPRRDYRAEAEALLQYVQRNVRYTRDAATADGVEVLQHPFVTLVQRSAGDCDDLSVALATLYALAGFPYAFRTVGCGEDPLDFQHVYVVVYVPQYGWLAADPSYEEPLGWEPSRCGETVMRDGSTVARVTTSKDWEPQ